MSRHADFFQETISATTEILGGTPGAWGAKMLAGIAIALMQSIEAATVAIAMFLALCILDAVLGVMRVYKRNKTETDKPNEPIKVWRIISGPASKWLVGGIVLLTGSFFDHVMFGAEAFLGGPMLKFFTGIVLGAITIEVTAKADYLQAWGISDKLRKRFPEFFSAEA
jgi:hypothetical protein